MNKFSNHQIKSLIIFKNKWIYITNKNSLTRFIKNYAFKLIKKRESGYRSAVH
ncbi:hypothetical protein FWK35_00005040 [Aphis craccivora]|uniref:Uncharacterized protein n=1 Tax=Aphis craccivora TaxID=307492 RepID=A0A6G0YWU0_APHCR|nr:hypothetical protein FWK35_00005040 [Aphis craccivora]